VKMEQPMLSKASDQTMGKDAWTRPQKILAVLLAVNLLMSLSTLTVAAVVGARMFDVTSPQSLCNTATTCFAETNLGFTDALAAGLDATRWTRVFDDVVQLAKQLKPLDWTLETKQPCNFLVHCGDLTQTDCTSFVGDHGGVCDWSGTYCESRASQPWQTQKVVPTQIVGCQFFQTASPCYVARPIAPAGTCAWDSASFRCKDADSTNPGRVEATCSEDFKINNDTQQDIERTIDRIQSAAQSYRTNATSTAVSSSLDITQYIARQLESNWTLTASACVSLASALLSTNVSAVLCDDVPECDSFAQWQVVVNAVQILCNKVRNAHIVVKESV